ncbi:MAG: Uma2 family endonuclease [Eubacterium sp.]|nr:Uma2 family endonuclease [Eubacterium sp.]
MRDNHNNKKQSKQYKDAAASGQPDLIRDPMAAYGNEGIGPYTVDDYMKLPEDVRVELIDGYFYDMASPLQLHQQLLGQLFLQVYHCIEKSGRPCEVYLAPSDVQLDCDIYTMVQPDLYVICDLQDPKQHAFQGAPVFVVEILSPSSRFHDMVRKYRKYRNAGVKEYWIVDPEHRKVMTFDFSDSQNGSEEGVRREYSFEDQIPIGISDGECSIDFAKISSNVKRFYE